MAQAALVQRTATVPIELLPDQTWLALRKLAFACARFGNHLLTANYAKAKGLPGLKAYTDAEGELSSAIRDAVDRECMGIWRRLGKKILRGEQTLARFSADRALVVRDRGVELELLDNKYVIRLRLTRASDGPRTELPVYMPALKRDKFLAQLLHQIADGEHRLSKASLQFERPGRKVFVRLSYEKVIEPETPGAQEAMLDYKGDAGELWLRANGRSLSLTQQITKLVSMKTHFKAIYSRLRRGLGKHRRRHDLRRALVKAGTFEEWSKGPVHQMTAEIVRWCTAQNCGRLRFIVPEGDLPWHRIVTVITYKCQEAGIEFTQTKPQSEP